jgi:hypothetical protein
MILVEYKRISLPTPKSTKMAMTTLAQDDFISLALDSDTYVPVNFIPETAHAMLKAWELSELTRTKDVTCFWMCANRATSSPDVSGSVDYEPVRCMAKVVPPKKFYRTFWRSIVRRLLEQDKETIIEIQRASSL